MLNDAAASFSCSSLFVAISSRDTPIHSEILKEMQHGRGGLEMGSTPPVASMVHSFTAFFRGGTKISLPKMCSEIRLSIRIHLVTGIIVASLEASTTERRMQI